GYCMDVMKQKGWDAEGLELDEELSRELNNGGYKVWNRKLEDFATDTRYDLITLFDVIEHIPNVDAAFTQLNHLLTDDGILVMITPNHASFQRKLFGKNWFQYKPIEHIQYFTLKTLSVFAERNGLRIVHHEKAGQHADAAFIINRLSYYNFPFLRKICNGLFSLFGLKNKCFYPGTGSLFVVLKKA
ncbi:MAG TPA: class I SAM-dependent methyltransferase, partial [Ferruginibacter sp.]|nr:class I SAM-dependent methyltransferase [Ferruginibacter sp.]